MIPLLAALVGCQAGIPTVGIGPDTALVVDTDSGGDADTDTDADGDADGDADTGEHAPCHALTWSWTDDQVCIPLDVMSTQGVIYGCGTIRLRPTCDASVLTVAIDYPAVLSETEPTYVGVLASSMGLSPDPADCAFIVEDGDESTTFDLLVHLSGACP